ncbi:MAG: hypothetical protein IJA69_06045, partial [Clostridia bacterium]|nr:hypothetical protein [Clostridia bacterium]
FAIFLPIIAIFSGGNLFAYAEGLSTISLENDGNYTNINIYGDNIFVSDALGGKVDIYSLKTNEFIKTFDGADTDDGKLVNATLTTVFGDNLYIYCSSEPNIYKIYVYNIETNEKLYCHNSFQYANVTKDLNRIVSLTTNSVGDIFAIGKYDTNYIFLKKSNNETNFSATLAGLSLDENSKILTSYSEEYIFIITTSNIYKIKSTDYSIEKTISASNYFTKANIDKDDNIYLLNDGQNFITKLSANTDYSTFETISYETSSNNIADFYIDVIDGDIFILDNIHRNIYIENKVNDISNVSNFINYDPETADTLKSQIEIATVTKDTIAYNYPYTISPHSTVTKNQEVFILNKDYNFYLCLITNKENYNIFVYINSKNLEIHDISSDTKTIKISSQSTPIYKLPSSLKAKLGSVDTLRLDLSISSGDTITSFRAINSPKDINNKMFYEVKFEDGSYGFIDTTSAYIVEENNEPETTIPTLQTNAYVINDNKNKIELFNLVGDEFVASGVFIDSETRVQIDKDKFDINCAYTEIKVLSNNEIITAYIKTENVRVDGVKIEIIIATILSVVCIVLATILTIYIKLVFI